LKIRGNPKLDILSFQENAFLKHVLLFPLNREVNRTGIPVPPAAPAIPENQ
jgi:hypothetical protein